MALIQIFTFSLGLLGSITKGQYISTATLNPGTGLIISLLTIFAAQKWLPAVDLYAPATMIQHILIVSVLLANNKDDGMIDLNPLNLVDVMIYAYGVFALLFRTTFR